MEQEIRDFLKNLTVEQIADSVYLFGVNFDNDSIEDICDRIYALLQEVTNLRKMIETINSEDKVLSPNHKIKLPTDSLEYKNTIIQDYSRKSSVLEVIMSNQSIFSEIFKRINNEYQTLLDEDDTIKK